MATSISNFQFERFSKKKWKGLRVLATRYWPQYVTKRESRSYYDAWLPTVAPSKELLRKIQSERISWNEFVRRYKKEMKAPEARNAIRMLASLGRREVVSVGCGCEDKNFCHRSVLQELVRKAGSSE